MINSVISTVIFDLDQTLVNRDATFKGFLEKQYHRFETHLQPTNTESFYKLIKRYDNNGYRAKDEVYALVCKDLNLNTSLTASLFDDFKKHYGFEPILFEDVHDTLTKLKPLYTLGLITNGRTIGQNAKIDNAKLRDYFKCIVISETEGVKKPNPIIFERCLERLGISPNEAVYVGDNPENDVRAARACGLKSIWCRNEYYPEIDFADGIINHLSELPEV